MPPKALAIANNDIVYLWWTYPEKIPDCVGFSIRRICDGKPTVALPSSVGLTPPPKAASKTAAKAKKTKTQWKTTDEWPIRSYQWKDLFVPEETNVRYEIVPMIRQQGGALSPDNGRKVLSNDANATDSIGRHTVVFNRGIISTQSLSSKLGKAKSGGPSKADLETHIRTVGDWIRNGLAGESVATMTSLFKKAREQGGKCYCAFYELTDPELIAAIKENKDRIEIILSNADSSRKVGKKTVKTYDGTNQAIRKELQPLLGNALHNRLLPKGNYIGHNKFVVYVDASDKAQEVLTGSTNWTPTGLCTQSNNVLILRDSRIADVYREYWKRLRQETDQGDQKLLQGEALRRADALPPSDLGLGAPPGSVRIWFSPNMERKTKPPKDPPCPPDMAEIFKAIEEAESGVLFLLFSAGAPSILQKIEEVSRRRQADSKLFFVRGAVSDKKTADQFATRVYNDSILKAPNRLITGIGGVDDAYDRWEKELAKFGNAVIHDKILVVDPFSDACVVVTGSHNLGYKASYSNDENLCIIRGSKEIAAAYTTHILDVVNHYNWRYTGGSKEKDPQAMKRKVKALYDLTTWQDKYFKGNFLKNRDMFFFPGS